MQTSKWMILERFLIFLPAVCWIVIRYVEWVTGGESPVPDVVVGAAIVATIAAVLAWQKYIGFRQRLSPGDFLRVLGGELADVKTRFMIRVCNADVLGLSENIFNRIAEADFWDWTYIGPHPSLSNFSPHLLNKMNEEYWNNKETIQTSALTLLDDYPLGCVNILFFGEIVMDRQGYEETEFPSHPPIDQKSLSLGFYRMVEYVVDSAAKSVEIDHLRKISTTEDVTTISRRWSDVYPMLLSRQSITAHWKRDKRVPKYEHVDELHQKLQEKVNSEIGGGVIIADNMTLRSIRERLSREIRWHQWPLFVIGYLLSPFSFYNDSFVNWPIAMFFAGLVCADSRGCFSICTGVFYLISNVVGVAMMWWPIRRTSSHVTFAFLQKFSRPTVVLTAVCLTVAFGLLAWFIYPLLTILSSLRSSW